MKKRVAFTKSHEAVLLPPHELRRQLNKERSRVDRFGGELALLVIAAREPGEARDALQPAAERLAQRIRSTDEIGWLEDGSIGVLLPGTDADGAWLVADAAFDGMDLVEPPHCTVYTYPHGYFPGDDLSQTDDSDGELPVRPSRPVLPLQDLFIEPIPFSKRVLDIVVSATALTLLAPLFAVVSLAIRWTSPGPAFFAQKRMGLGRRPFTLYKFRSMAADADRRQAELRALNEVDGPAFKIARDPRVTKIGRLIRATCIDELPQLWNVLRGDMSLVGPRPLPWGEACQCIRWQTRRFDVLPGLTCFWQVRESRNSIPFTEWMRLDLSYVRRWTLTEDLRLIWKTAVVMLGGRGI